MIFVLEDGEKVLGFTLDVAQEGVESSTRGFVGDTVFAVLPNIKPGHCFAITVALQAVGIHSSLQLPSSRSCSNAIACSLTPPFSFSPLVGSALPRQTLETTDLQSLCLGSDPFGLHELLVWMARSREGCSARAGSAEVRLRRLLFSSRSSSFVRSLTLLLLLHFR